MVLDLFRYTQFLKIKEAGLVEADLMRIDPWIVKLAVAAVKYGEVIPVCLGQVYALLGDARNSIAERKARDVKNRSLDKPFGILASPETTSMAVDLERIAEQVQKCFQESWIRKNFAAKGFMRFPVKNWEMNNLARGTFNGADKTLQTFTFEGDSIAFGLEVRMRRKLENAHKHGLGEILVTSFNVSGQPSIIDKGSAIKLAREKNLGILIHRSDMKMTGSYSIYGFDNNGITKLRHGTGSEAIDRELGL